MMKEMYKGKVNSPETLLSEQITAAKTDIKVEDASVLPTGPNLAVIGIGVDAETIKYSGINNNILVGCTRGFQGIAKVWDANTPIARNFTEYDIGSLQENVTELYEIKLEADSKLDTNKVDFVEATQRTNILDTDNLKTMFGKIKKYFADLKTIAFTGKASDLQTDDSNLLVTKAEKTTWNNKYDAETKLTVAEIQSTSATIIALFKTIGTKLSEMAQKLVPTGGTVGQVLKKTATGFEWGNDKDTTYTAGTNVTINENIISATDTTYDVATTDTDGLMSSTDKVKLDGIEAGAEKNTISSVQGRTGAVTISKSDVGLGSVNNVAITAAQVTKINELNYTRAMTQTQYNALSTSEKNRTDVWYGIYE